MVMQVIENAFDEGRQTKVNWNKSQAKRDAIKLTVNLENFSAMTERERMSILPVDMICPNTGKVLASFPNRLAAATHIVNNILKRPEKNPISVTGNMDICMRGGWKSYGYYWKVNNGKPAKMEIPEGFDISDGIALYRYGKYWKTCYSYAEIAKLTNIDRGVLRKRFLRGSPIDDSGLHTLFIPPKVKAVKGYVKKKPVNTGFKKRVK